MWLSVLYFIVPLIWLFVSSTKSNSDLFTTFGLWFGHDFNLFANIHDVFTYQDGIYARWALNTVIYAGVSAVGATAARDDGGVCIREVHSSPATSCCSASPWARS